jgi:hypothetical protein
MNLKKEVMADIEEFLQNLLQPIIKKAVAEAMAESVPQAVEEKNFTRLQLCERWAITLPTLNNYVNGGKITPIHIGRRVLFPEGEVKRAESAGVGRYRHIL